MTSFASFSARDTVYVALFTALVVVFSLLPPVPLAGIPVPITLQTLGVMIAAAMLGPKLGVMVMGLYTLLWAAGLPVLPGGRGGLGVLAGPTGGFLIGMVLGAWVTGGLAERLTRGLQGRWQTVLAYALACLVGGVAVVYAVGVPWLAAVTGMGLTKAAVGSLVFIPGDLVKVGLAAVVVEQVRRSLPLR